MGKEKQLNTGRMTQTWSKCAKDGGHSQTLRLSFSISSSSSSLGRKETGCTQTYLQTLFCLVLVTSWGGDCYENRLLLIACAYWSVKEISIPAWLLGNSSFQSTASTFLKTSNSTRLIVTILTILDQHNRPLWSCSIFTVLLELLQ